MGLRTAEQYLESLRDGREVYYDGERVVDIVAHPVLGTVCTTLRTCLHPAGRSALREPGHRGGGRRTCKPILRAAAQW